MDVKVDSDDFVAAFARLGKVVSDEVLGAGTYAAAKVAQKDLIAVVPERTGKMKRSVRVVKLDTYHKQVEENHKPNTFKKWKSKEKIDPKKTVGHVVLMGQDKRRRWADAWYAPFLEEGTGTKHGNHLMKRTAQSSVPEAKQAFMKAVRRALEDLEE